MCGGSAQRDAERGQIVQAHVVLAQGVTRSDETAKRLQIT